MESLRVRYSRLLLQRLIESLTRGTTALGDSGHVGTTTTLRTDLPVTKLSFV